MAQPGDALESGSEDEQLISSVTLPSAEQVARDIRAVNEQLLLAGLREQALADQLRRQLAFTSAITTSLGEGVFVLDVAGQCTFANPAAEHMLGWTGEELRGQSISRVFPRQARRGSADEALPAALQEVLQLGTPHHNEDGLFVRKDGELFPSAYTAAPIVTDGQTVGAVVSFRDVTEVRRLQQIREEYATLISHDLRAPLTVVLGHAQILLGKLTQQRLSREAESARIVVESSLRMNDLIEDLLERSHSDASIYSRQRSVVDLVAVVKQMLEQTIVRDDYERVRLDAIPSLPVVVNTVQIERVIVNLLTNALKFSAPDAPIVVRVYEQAADAVIAVTDRGIGIAPEDLPHVFEKKYRAPTARQIAGKGLGLYSCRLIVESLGGRLSVESAVGEGSTFVVRLPRSI